VTKALRLEHVVLDEDAEPVMPAKWLAAGDGADPAVVVELRDRLRELAEARDRKRRRRPVDRRVYCDEQVARALALVAQGRSLSEAGAAVGAAVSTVARWRDAA
jgi:hypothetical protein